MDSASEANITDTISAITQRRRLQPLYVVHGDQRGWFYVAKWKLPPHRIASECVRDHMLICQVEGSAAVSKFANGTSVRKHARPGIVTFIPTGERAQYVVESDCTFLELYISPALIRWFSEQHTTGSLSFAIRSLFAVEDPWLAGYCRMLASEIELYCRESNRFDSLFFDQAQHLLLGHLLRAYSDATGLRLQARARRSSGCALRPHLLRRVTEFIGENLGRDLYLKELADLVHLSEAHFIRAFHAAAGCTPYRYMLEERLRACAELLRADDAMSIAQVAASLGFKSQSHFATMFKARYGMTPTRFRHTRDL